MTQYAERIKGALASAPDTRSPDRSARQSIGHKKPLPRSSAKQPVIVVADANTFDVAGRRLFDILRSCRTRVRRPFVFTSPTFPPSIRAVTDLQDYLQDRAGDCSRRRLWHDQRYYQARVASRRPALHVRGDGRVDGWVRLVRRVDHSGWIEGYFLLARRRAWFGGSGNHLRRAGRTERGGVRRLAGESHRRRGLDPRRCAGRRAEFIPWRGNWFRIICATG